MQVNLSEKAKQIALQAVERGEYPDADSYVSEMVEITEQMRELPDGWELTPEDERKIQRGLEELAQGQVQDGPSIIHRLEDDSAVRHSQRYRLTASASAKAT